MVIPYHYHCLILHKLGERLRKATQKNMKRITKTKETRGRQIVNRGKNWLLMAATMARVR